MDKQISELDYSIIDPLIANALKEDIGEGDITTNLLISGRINTKALIKSKSDGVIAGLEIAERIFKSLDSDVKWVQHFNDGDKVNNGAIVVDFEGTFKAVLTGERTALNFLQRMSGIATETSKYVDAVRHTKAKILDSRKTVPGLRYLDKYAVKTGGGMNHRIGLYDMVLIKDNHISIAGGITNAVKHVKSKLNKKIKIEVEVSKLSQVEEALKAGVDIIMLDNLDNATMKKAVEIIGDKALTEASGNMSIERVKEVAETGVDYISVGAITHSVKSMDIALYIVNQE